MVSTLMLVGTPVTSGTGGGEINVNDEVSEVLVGGLVSAAGIGDGDLAKCKGSGSGSGNAKGNINVGCECKYCCGDGGLSVVVFGFAFTASFTASFALFSFVVVEAVGLNNLTVNLSRGVSDGGCGVDV